MSDSEVLLLNQIADLQIKLNATQAAFEESDAACAELETRLDTYRAGLQAVLRVIERDHPNEYKWHPAWVEADKALQSSAVERLTHPFSETVEERRREDPEFAEALDHESQCRKAAGAEGLHPDEAPALSRDHDRQYKGQLVWADVGPTFAEKTKNPNEHCFTLCRIVENDDGSIPKELVSETD